MNGFRMDIRNLFVMDYFFYSVFDLNIKSEIECPELQPGCSDAIVLIKYGEVPKQINEPKLKGVRFECNEREFLLKVDGVAKYYVANNTIIIEKLENADLDSIRLFLLSSALAALVIQNGYFPLKASTIEKDGKAFLIGGDMKAGKSTLSTMFYKKQYHIISDDVSVLKFENDRIISTLGIIYPVLWEDSIEILNENLSDLKKIRHNVSKYRFTKVSDFYCENHKVIKLFYIKTGKEKEIVTQKIEAVKEKLLTLYKIVFQENFIFGKKLKSEQLFENLEICKKLEFWEIIRPKQGNTLDEIINFIENKLD